MRVTLGCPVLVFFLAVGGLAACNGQEPSWVETCVKETRRYRDLCECLDGRRIVEPLKIAAGNVGGRVGPSGSLELPITRELDVEDEKICRAQILERLNREHPLQ